MKLSREVLIIPPCAEDTLNGIQIREVVLANTTKFLLESMDFMYANNNSLM